MDMGLNDWVVLVVLVLIAIFALMFASFGAGGTQATIGLIVSAAAIIAIFYRIKQFFDRADASRH